MKAEHLLHGTESLLRAAVFLVVLIAGASSLRIEVCGVRSVEVGGMR